MSGLNRRSFLKSVGCATIAAWSGNMPGEAAAFKSAAGSRKRPNVLLIMTDDQGWGDIHFHGNEKIDTPVMDELAGAGARFERFFVNPLCAPTRASLLTGRYYLRGGVHGVTGGRENMDSTELTIGEVFKENGYATGCFGKWHNGAHYPQNPMGQGFEQFVGFCAGHWNNYFDTELEYNGSKLRSKGYITDVLTDEAITFIRKNRNRNFFCYVPYNAPHSPWQVPDEYFEKYKQRGLDDKTACAYGMVENADDNMGRLLQCLDSEGLTENTIVIFLTDNGANSDRYNGHMRGRKGSVHEGGSRVPCFIRWPGRIAPATKIDQIAAHIDLLPTLVDLCGVEKPAGPRLDGVSLAALLKGDSTSVPERTIYTHPPTGSDIRMTPGAARNQRYRYIITSRGQELYDMAEDPSEKNNIARKLPEITSRMGRDYKQWFEDVTKGGIEVGPVEIGHAVSPLVALAAHEAKLHGRSDGGIDYHGGQGWANDWISRWNSTDAWPWWDIKVVADGLYSVTLRYTCSSKNTGGKVRAVIGDRKLDGVVDTAYNPQPLKSPDRVKRKEVYEKHWAPLELGTTELKKGCYQLKIEAMEIPAEEILDLKAVELLLIRQGAK